jgi:hypothetical protein
MLGDGGAQPRPFIKHLPRIPQVELHGLHIAGAADGLAVATVARGGPHFPKPRDQPLPVVIDVIEAMLAQHSS